jgi:hypothetical protein
MLVCRARLDIQQTIPVHDHRLILKACVDVKMVKNEAVYKCLDVRNKEL